MVQNELQYVFGSFFISTCVYVLQRWHITTVCNYMTSHYSIFNYIYMNDDFQHLYPNRFPLDMYSYTNKILWLTSIAMNVCWSNKSQRQSLLQDYNYYMEVDGKCVLVRFSVNINLLSISTLHLCLLVLPNVSSVHSI